MKDLKDILLERLVLSKNKSASSITLGDFMRWYAADVGKPPLDTDDDIVSADIKLALDDNDKGIENSQLVRFYNKHKNDSLLDLKEEIIQKSTYQTIYQVSFMVDDVYFTVRTSESFEEYLKTI